MSEERPKRENRNMEEATVSNMWGMAALAERKTVRRLLMDLVEGHLGDLEKKGLLPKGKS